jgi:hypothetical protein
MKDDIVSPEGESCACRNDMLTVPYLRLYVKGLRVDGRRPAELRRINCKTGIVLKADGTFPLLKYVLVLI